jgi:phosphonopyruvate decarboxylase
MIKAEDFVQIAKKKGFGLYAGVPCSFLKPFINYVIDSPDIQYVGAANEGEAVAIAAGAELAGMRSVAMFQNSGLGNAVNPLTSLHQIFQIPILLIVTWRGEPEGAPDEPQHKLMGAITPQLLEVMQIPWAYFPTETEQIEATLDNALEFMVAHQKPYALVMTKGSVESVSLNSRLALKSPSAILEPTPTLKDTKYSRQDILQVIQTISQSNDILLATTGYSGRELYALEDRDNQFYMVGSMGCVSSIGLGIALVKPRQRVMVIDGDGAILMRLGALATIGYERPANLRHILLDNQCHESTGGQSTVSHSIDFCTIAAACGYEKIACATTPQEVQTFIESASDKLSFLHVKIKPGIPDKLPRPKITPPEVANRLRQFLQKI